jgi:uncharacterized protein (TIGR03435 family)
MPLMTVLLRGMFCVALASAVLGCDWLQASASQQPGEPHFEVASVKPNSRNDGQIMVGSQGGRYTAIGVSLGVLIRSAYQVQEFQIIGGPGWLDSDRFDVVAKEPDGAGASVGGSIAPARLQPMLRALLSERFKLVAHRETRQLPVFALVMARSDRGLGPHLRPSTADCPSACGTRVGPGLIETRGRTMAQLAAAFSTLTNTGSTLNRLIVDRTGLEGNFDVDLRFTPENLPNFGPGGPPPGMAPIDPNGPSIFAAVQEQLGLKLAPERGPVEVLVVDRVEHPTEE